MTIHGYTENFTGKLQVDRADSIPRGFYVMLDTDVGIELHVRFLRCFVTLRIKGRGY